jgi:hypothetical protein
MSVYQTNSNQVTIILILPFLLARRQAFRHFTEMNYRLLGVDDAKFCTFKPIYVLCKVCVRTFFKSNYVKWTEFVCENRGHRILCFHTAVRTSWLLVACLDSSTVMTRKSVVVTFGFWSWQRGHWFFASVNTFGVWGSVRVCVCMCVRLRLLVLLHGGLVLGLALVVLA